MSHLLFSVVLKTWVRPNHYIESAHKNDLLVNQTSLHSFSNDSALHDTIIVQNVIYVPRKHFDWIQTVCRIGRDVKRVSEDLWRNWEHLNDSSPRRSQIATRSCSLNNCAARYAKFRFTWNWVTMKWGEMNFTFLSGSGEQVWRLEGGSDPSDCVERVSVQLHQSRGSACAAGTHGTPAPAVGGDLSPGTLAFRWCCFTTYAR